MGVNVRKECRKGWRYIFEMREEKSEYSTQLIINKKGVATAVNKATYIA